MEMRADDVHARILDVAVDATGRFAGTYANRFLVLRGEAHVISLRVSCLTKRDHRVAITPDCFWGASSVCGTQIDGSNPLSRQYCIACSQSATSSGVTANIRRLPP